MAIAESISYPTSPVTPPATTDDVDAVTETRPRRSTVQGMRRKDLYSLFSDSDGLFDLAVKFASSDEWGSDDSSGETTPMSETRPTSRTMAAPPPLPMYLKEEMESRKSIMERIDEDHPSPSPLEEPRKRSSSASDILSKIPTSSEALGGLPLFSLPTLLHLASSKHGSNVAEMVLMRASPPQLEQIRGQIFGTEQPEQLREMMSSPFGNYVLQALLRQLLPEQHAAALQRIEAETSSSNFGRAIIAAAAAA